MLELANPRQAIIVVSDELPCGDHVIIVGDVVDGGGGESKRLFYAGGGFTEKNFTTTKTTK